MLGRRRACVGGPGVLGGRGRRFVVVGPLLLSPAERRSKRDADDHQDDHDQHPRRDRNPTPHGAAVWRRRLRRRRRSRSRPSASGRSSWSVGRSYWRRYSSDQLAAVEPEVVRVGPQEGLGVDLAREQAPLLVLDRAQVLGADLGARLDLTMSILARMRASRSIAPISSMPLKATPAPPTEGTAVAACRRPRAPSLGRDGAGGQARAARASASATGSAGRRPR